MCVRERKTQSHIFAEREREREKERERERASFNFRLFHEIIVDLNSQ